MAQIINDRDKALQTAPYRSITDSVTISGTASAFLASKNTITILPATITLTATPSGSSYGPLAVYTWSYATSAQPNTWVSLSLSAVSDVNRKTQVLNNTDSWVTNPFVTYRCIVTEDLLDTSYAYYTVSFTREASDPVVINLSRTNVLVTCDSNGNALTPITNTDQTITVSRGTTALTYSSNTTTPNSFNVGTPIAAKLSLGTISNTTNEWKQGNINSIDVDGDGTTITYPITVYDSATPPAATSYTKTVVYNKVSNGVIGANGAAGENLYPIVNYDFTGTLPTGVTYTTSTGVGPGTVTSSDSSTTTTIQNTSADQNLRLTNLDLVPANSYIISMRVKFLSGIWEGKVYYTNSIAGQTENENFYKAIPQPAIDVWTTINLDMRTLTAGGTAYMLGGNIRQLRFDFINNTTSQVAIDYISIGKFGVAEATKSITVSMYVWIPSTLTQTPTFTQPFTYTWDSGIVSNYPVAYTDTLVNPSVVRYWASVAGSAPNTGYILYQRNITITDVRSAVTTTNLNWEKSSVNTIGYNNAGDIGPQGDSYRIAYAVTYGVWTNPTTPPSNLALAPRLAVTITGTNATTNEVTISTAMPLIVGTTITITGTSFGNVLTNNTYYVRSVSTTNSSIITLGTAANPSTTTLAAIVDITATTTTANITGYTNSWSFTATANLADGQYMYQSDGILNSNQQNPTITWGVPYLSNLKVGSLSAISATLGNVSVGTAGALRSGKETYNSAAAGFFLGNDGGAPKFKIGTLEESGKDIYSLGFDTTTSTLTLRGASYSNKSGNSLITPDTLPSEIQNSAVKVGGINLILNSGNFTSVNGWTTNSGAAVSYTNTVLYGDYGTLQITGTNGIYNNNIMRLKPNTQYTVSAIVKGSLAIASGSNQTLHIQTWTNAIGEIINGNQETVNNFDTAVTTEWKQIYQTFTTPTTAMTFTGGIGGTSNTVLTVTGTISGTIKAGMYLTGGTIPANTYIVSGSGRTWTLNQAAPLTSGTTITATNDDLIYCRFYFYPVNNVQLNVANVQLEEGNKATAWAPNPTEVSDSLAGLSLIGNGVTLSGNTIRKTATTTAWDSQAYSREAYIGGAFVSFVPLQTNGNVAVGLNTSADKSNSSIVTLDYAISISNDSNIYVFESGNTIDIFESGTNIRKTYTTSDVFSVTYDGSNIRYFQNNTLIRGPIPVAITEELYFDSSFYDFNSGITKVKYGALTSNAWGSILGTGRPENDANKTYVDTTTGAIQGVSSGTGTIVDNTKVKVGGANLLKNSTKASFGTVQSGTAVITTESGTLPDGSTGNLIKIVGGTTAGTIRIPKCIRGNNTYSFGVFHKVSSGTPKTTVDTCDNTTGDLNHTTAWQYTTFENITVTNYTYELYNFVDLNYPASKTIYLYHPKVEYGNKATDWNYAQEDTLSDIDSWIVQKYNIDTSVGTAPSYDLINTVQVASTKYLPNSTTQFTWSTDAGISNVDKYIGRAACTIYSSVEWTWIVSIAHDDNGVIYINGTKVYDQGIVALTSRSLSIPAGWCTIELLWAEQAGSDYFILSNPININPQISEMWASLDFSGQTAAAAQTASWPSVTGVGRPENNATVGANFLTNVTNRPTSTNLVKLGTFTSVETGWTAPAVAKSSVTFTGNTLDGVDWIMAQTAQYNYESNSIIPVQADNVIWFSGYVNNQYGNFAADFGYRAVIAGVIQNSWYTNNVKAANIAGWTYFKFSITIAVNITGIIPFAQMNGISNFGTTYWAGLCISREEPYANRTYVDSAGAIQGVSQNEGIVVQNSKITVTDTGAISGIGTGNNTVVQNTKISVNDTGAISGIGTGDGTVVQNTKITVTDTGAISGIGTGNNTVVQNTKITVTDTGAISGIGTGNNTAVANSLVETLSLIGTGVTISGNTISKNSDLAESWTDAHAYSRVGYTGGAYVSFVSATNTSIFMIGLNTSSASDLVGSAGFSGLDYAIYCTNNKDANDNNLIYIYESGNSISTTYTYDSNDVFSITYDGSNIRYFKNITLIRGPIPVEITKALYFDSAFYSPGSVAKKIQFGPLTSNAWGSILGEGRPDNYATVGANASNLKVGTGNNLCVNSDFTSISNWAYSYYLVGADVGLNLNNDSTINKGVGEGTGTIYLYQPNATASGYQELGSEPIVVVPGNYYFLSGYSGANRCLVTLFVYYYDINNNIIGNSSGTSNTTYTGGNLLSGYYRHKEKIIVPATFLVNGVPTPPAYVRVYLRKSATITGNSNSYMFVTRVMFEETGPAAIEPGNWCAPGVGKTVITSIADKLKKSGADIMTGPISFDVPAAITIGTKNADGAITNGLYLGNTGIVGVKNSQTVFSVDNNGDAIFKGNITGATGTFSGSLNVKNATSGSRIEILTDRINVYNNDVLRVVLGNIG